MGLSTTHYREKGRHMADTIEWLETIGKSAKLRRASVDELALALQQADASDALKAAVMFGDRTRLAAELGDRLMQSDESSNTIPYEDEPVPQDTPHPAAPPKRDHEKPSHDL